MTKPLSLLTVLAGGLVLSLAASTPAYSQKIPDFSGLAPLNSDSVVVVSDAKAKKSLSHLFIYNLNTNTESGSSLWPIYVSSWGKDQSEASDLEAICRAPRESTELVETEPIYYLAESGYWKGNGGRIFKLKLTASPDTGYQGQILGSFKPFSSPASGITDDASQIEGMQALPLANGNTLMVLGLRGDKTHPGTLCFGVLDSKLEYREEKQYSIDLRQLVPAGRSCSDLLLQEEAPGQYQVLTSACADPGDFGPFTSCVCQIGRLTIKGSDYTFTPQPAQVLYRLDGCKIEAITQTPSCIPFSSISVGTDDEGFTSLFRPLPQK